MKSIQIEKLTKKGKNRKERIGKEKKKKKKE